MTSREKILTRVKQHQGLPIGATTIAKTPIVNFDVVQHFKKTLISIGGQPIEMNKLSNLDLVLQKLFPSFNEMKTIIPSRNQFAPSDRLALADVKIAVLRGDFAVAENGAVWLTDACMGDRVLPFICEHLVLILERSSIVATMHHAYDRIGDSVYGLGIFIAGPSKTADIEQSLVLGAHGAKSLTVLMVD
jgi:L-lactate dehydrogenase complex protein LldG